MPTMPRQEEGSVFREPDGTTPCLAGFDAAGRVEAVGAEVRGFLPGDRVWYAGAMQRQGSNAQYQCVDERLVAKMPEGTGMQEAAALPLS